MSTPTVVGPAWDWGDRMRKVRRSIANMPQGEFCRMLGVPHPTYGAWESGRTQPPLKIARQIAERIEARFPGRVSAAWVLGIEHGEGEAGEGLLPWMDSNHQPPDWRSDLRKALRLNGFDIPARHDPPILSKR